jgi:DNA-binding MarR family transcriptional regulator
VAKTLSQRVEAQEFDLDVLGDLVGYQLHRAEIESYRNFLKLFRHPKSTPKQFSALVLIGANPGISQIDLGSLLGMDRATTTAVIDKLEDRNLLTRQRSKADRRKQELHLTVHGKESLKLMKSRVRAHDEEITSNLTNAEKKLVKALLAKMRANDSSAL